MENTEDKCVKIVEESDMIPPQFNTPSVIPCCLVLPFLSISQNFFSFLTNWKKNCIKALASMI